MITDRSLTVLFHFQQHVGIQDKLEREIKLRDGASRMLDACTHEDQLLEVAKTLHTSNARMYTYMAELQRLKTAEIMEKVMDDEGYKNLAVILVLIKRRPY